MAPRGGKRCRTKICGSAQKARASKRQNTNSGPIIDPRIIPSTSTHSRPFSTPTNPMRSSQSGQLHPVRTGSSSVGTGHRRTAPVPDDESPDSDYGAQTSSDETSDEEDEDVYHTGDSDEDEEGDEVSEDGDEVGDEVAEEAYDVDEESNDNDAEGLDAVGSSGTVRGRGPNKSKKPRKFGEGKKRAKLFGGKLNGRGIPGYFTSHIKMRVNAFWPYRCIDPVIKQRIWESFLDVYYIVGGTVELAREAFEVDAARKWRQLLTHTRREALKSLNVSDPELLRGTQPPYWLNDQAIWEQYVEHWCNPKQRALGEIGRKNRLSSSGRPDGKPSTHALGSKSLQVRMIEIEEKTGKPASALDILVDLNQKKNKVTAEPTGEYYNLNFKEAYDEYVVLFEEKYGPGVDPKSKWDKHLWKRTKPVIAGLVKGRILGGGIMAWAEYLMDDGAGPSNAASVSSDVVRDLQEKNEELQRELQVVNESNAGLKEELWGVKEQMNKNSTEMKQELSGMKELVNNLTNMMTGFFAGSARATGQFMSVSTPTGTATGLLASMHQPAPVDQPLHTPDAQIPAPAPTQHQLQSSAAPIPPPAPTQHQLES